MGGVGLSQPAYTSGVATAVQQIIENTANTGLLETHNSLAYRVGEIERHIHSRERWLSKLAVPAGNRVTETGLVPFVAASGGAAYGVEIQILDTSDTPQILAMAYFDLHRLWIMDVDHTTAYRMQLIYGTGTCAAAVAAFQYTEVMFRANGTGSDRAPLVVQMPRAAAGTKMWAKVWNATNLSEVDFVFGLHEYEG